MDKAKWGLGGLVVGAIVWWITLANGFGWMSASSAQQLADQQTHNTLVAYASNECVARFEEQKPEVILADWQKLKAAQNADSYSFDAVAFLKKTPAGGQNLLTLPGQKLSEDIASDVASACTDAVAKLKQVGALTLTMPPKTKKS